MKRSGYMTRAMSARDPRYARILGKLGYERTDMVATDDEPEVKRKRGRPRKEKVDEAIHVPDADLGEPAFLGRSSLVVSDKTE